MSEPEQFDFDLKIAKLELEPGDFLIFKTDFRLDLDQVIALRDRIGKQVPEGVKFMLVTYGVQIARLRGKDVPLKWKRIAYDRTQSTAATARK